MDYSGVGVPKGTDRLELWWSPERGDNVSVAHPETLKAVKDSKKYVHVRLQGYVPKVPTLEQLDGNGGYKYKPLSRRGAGETSPDYGAA